MGLGRTDKQIGLAQRQALRRARLQQEKDASEAKAAKERQLQEALKRKASQPQPIHQNPVYKIAPRLAQASRQTQIGIGRVMLLPHVRELAQWRPIGKSEKTLFRSLCNHLLAKFQVSQVLWNGLLVTDAEDPFRLFNSLVAHVAMGGSLYNFVQDTKFPIPLTRKMCHEALGCSADLSLLLALRRAQVRSAGGTLQQFQALSAGFWGRQYLQPTEEAFWQTFVEWLARNPMLNPSEIRPLCDYVQFCRNQRGPEFSMKGRSPLALLRDMRVWHQNLQRDQFVQRQFHGHPIPKKFTPSGFKAAEFDFSRTDPKAPRKEIWRVFEILSYDDLRAEGKRMHHCVSSYAWRVADGSTSIWAMTKEDDCGDWAQLTIEVSNRARSVVQARGICNRLATAQESNILTQWAGRNGLGIAIGRW